MCSTLTVFPFGLGGTHFCGFDFGNNVEVSDGHVLGALQKLPMELQM
jgi:hypothetical protein